MVGRSARLVAIHLLGALLVGGWSLAHVVGDGVTRENAAGVIVFPLAWIFGFWPTVVPIALAHRLWRLQATLEELCQRRAIGDSTVEQQREFEDVLVMLAARENGIPERWARHFVRRVLAALQSRPASK